MLGARPRPVLALVIALGTAFLALAACSEKKPPPPAPSPSPAESVAATLGVDASVFSDTADPPPPAGDLKKELDAFVNIEACVTERAKLDPLVGDALRAISYDTFLRDACRLLEAAKDKKRESCDKIDSSALRARCQSWVAIVSQTPDSCPLQYEAVLTRGRQPTCIAVAGKDPRLCSGEARATARTSCEALALRDATKCEALAPTERASCQREVARWRSLLAPPLEGLPKLRVPHGKLTLRGDSGTPDPAMPEVDLASEFARGAVVVTGRSDRARLELGSLTELDSVRFAAAPQKRPRAAVAILVEPGATAKDALKATLQKLEVEIPGEGTLVYPGGATCDCKLTASKVDRTRGGEIAILLDGSLSLGTRRYKITFDVGTFVRDVVAEGTGTRVLPPIHPAITPR